MKNKSEIKPLLDVLPIQKEITINEIKEYFFDLLLFILLFILLSIGLLLPVQTDTRNFAAGILKENTKIFHSNRSALGPLTPLSFGTNVSGMDEVWEWMRGPLSDFLLLERKEIALLPTNPGWWGNIKPSECNATSVPASKRCRYIPDSGYENRTRWRVKSSNIEVLGSIRFRQFRVRKNTCNYRTRKTCYGEYNQNTVSTSYYGANPKDIGERCGFTWYSQKEMGYGSTAISVPTKTGTILDPNGFVLDVHTQDSWTTALDYLQHNGWVDAATRAIMIEFSLRNPNTNSFCGVMAIIDRDISGPVRTEFVVNFLTLPTEDSPYSSVRFITDMICFVLVLVLSFKVYIGGLFAPYLKNQSKATQGDDDDYDHDILSSSLCCNQSSRGACTKRPRQYFCATRDISSFNDRVWRFLDFCFCCVFFASFGYDMYVFSFYSSNVSVSSCFFDRPRKKN